MRGRGRNPRPDAVPAAPPEAALRRPAPAGWRWGAPSCASRRCSCSTSRCRTSTPSCAAYTRQEIKKLHQRIGVTTVFVTHDQIEAMTLADRVVVMNGGHIEQIGTRTRSIGRLPACSSPASSALRPPNLIPRSAAAPWNCGWGKVVRPSRHRCRLPGGGRSGVRPSVRRC